MDALIVICIIIIAAVYIAWTFYKSQKTDDHGNCGCGTHKGGCTGCGGMHHNHKGNSGNGTDRSRKDGGVNIQLKRK